MVFLENRFSVLTFGFPGFVFGLIDGFDFLANLASSRINIFLYTCFGIFAAGDRATSWAGDFGKGRAAGWSGVGFVAG